MNWLTHRPEIKLIVLGLAVALYFFTASQIEIEKRFEIEIGKEDIDIEPGWIVSTILPLRLNVRVVGPKGVIDDLEEKDVRPTLVVADELLQQGWQSFDITERTLGLPAAAGLADPIGPIRLEFSELIDRTMKLDDQFDIEGLPSGYSYSTELLKTHVTVRGPRTVIEELLKKQSELEVQKLVVENIDVPPGGEGFTISQVIRVKRPNLSLEIPDEDLHVTITLKPLPMQQQTPSLPIHLLISPEDQQRYSVELYSKEVVLDVSGPRNLMEDYNLNDLRAYIDISGPQQLDVSQVKNIVVKKPKWLEYKPQQVKVTVRLRTAAPPPPPEPEVPPVPPEKAEQTPPPVEVPGKP